MICEYTPNKSENEEAKDTFYDELEQVYNVLPGYCIKLLLGNMNAQVGKENAYKVTIRKHSLHDRSNEKGIRLIHFAISKNIW